MDRATALSTVLNLGLALCVAAAGCVISETSGEPSSDGIRPTDEKATQGTAFLRGLVTDSEFVPVANASTALFNPNAPDAGVRNATTDAAGRFSFERLNAGEYFLNVSKPGYRDAPPTQLMINDGADLSVTVVLEALPTLKPFHETRSVAFEITYQACILSPVYSVCPLGVYGANSDKATQAISVDERLTGDLQTMIVEMAWSPAAPACRGSMLSEVFSPQGDARQGMTKSGPFYWDNLPRTRSPTYLFIPRDGADASAMHSAHRSQQNGGQPIQTTGVWTIRLRPAMFEGELGTPVDYTCNVKQVVSSWMTMFYLQPAPPEWSVSREGAGG